jgi:hypothetical protein
MKVDIFYPVIEQGEYGQPKKKWVFDRTVVCNATPFGKYAKDEINPASFLQLENQLIGRVKADPRLASKGGSNAITNILMTNIRNSGDEPIYVETAGVRTGKATIYELATVQPFVGPFGDVEYYRLLLRRAENQTVGE